MMTNFGWLFYWRNAEEKPQNGWVLRRLLLLLTTSDSKLRIRRGKSMEKWENFCWVRHQKNKKKYWIFNKRKKKKRKFDSPHKPLLSNPPFKLQEDFLPVDPPTHHNFSQFLLHKGYFRQLRGQASHSSLQRAINGVDSLKMEWHCIIFIW